MEGVTTYSKLERVEQATCIFKSRVENRIRGSNIPDKYVDQVLADVLLANATNDIEELEAEVAKFTGNHKTDIFYDVQNSSTKLNIFLDNIDVSDSIKARESRYALYSRLTLLSEKLEGTIHEGHSECDKCVQVKIVMPNMSN